MRSILTTALLLVLGLPAFATKVIGNGGDTLALEFVIVAKDIHSYLELVGSKAFNTKQLESALKETKVESTDKKLSLDKVPKDAINYPLEKRILFNRTAWMNTKESLKPGFVLHEYLGIMGINDSSYKISTSALSDFSYGKKVTEVEGPFTVNFATSKQFALKAHVTLENYGPQSWHYSADEEQIRLIVEAHGKRKVFLLPTKGRIISAYSSTDGEDDGLNISILQPLKDKNGNPKIHQEDKSYSEYILHVIRDYRIEFHGTEGELPDDAEFVGPISNMAG